MKALNDRIDYLKDEQQEIIDNIKNAKNITPDRVIAWGKQMSEASMRLAELELVKIQSEQGK